MLLHGLQQEASRATIAMMEAKDMTGNHWPHGQSHMDSGRLAGWLAGALCSRAFSTVPNHQSASLPAASPLISYAYSLGGVGVAGVC